MKVQDVMTRNPQACSPETNLAAAAELMWTKDCGILPVLDEAGKVAGIVTDRDMLIALGTRNARPSDVNVRDVMTAPAATCRPGDDIDTALSKMNARRVRRLPVVSESGTLTGILTMNDIVLRADRKGAREIAVPYEDVMSALKGICGHGQTVRPGLTM